MTTVYGIKNCDTIKKTLKWLEEHQVQYQFHDYRKNGLTADLLTQFELQLGWEQLINKRGTTFRQLSESDKQALDQTTALQHMLTAPAMIKRPLIQHDGQWQLGFNQAQLKELFNV